MPSWRPEFEPVHRGVDLRQREGLVDVGREPLLGDEADHVGEFGARAKVEPNTASWRMKSRRKSAEGSSPVVAPQVTSRPPRTSARIAVGHTALPTFSITTSTPRSGGELHHPVDTDEPPTSQTVSAAPNAGTRSSFA